jgi:hypothetical protein
MPSKNSYAELILDFQELVRSTEMVPELLPSIEAERQVLVQVLADVERLRTRQAELTALKQRATQELREAIERGKEARIQVRSVLRGKVGPKNELLTQFKVAPLRKRKRKPAEADKEKPNGENPGTDGSTPASPSGKDAA